MTIDLSSIEQTTLSLLGALLLALLSAAAKVGLQRLGISVTAAQQEVLNELAHKSVAYGIVNATDTIKTKGWDHIETKNAVVAAAGTYAVTQFPAVLKQAGIDVSNPALAAKMLADGIMTRVFPTAVQYAAYSPATPPADLVAKPVAAGAPNPPAGVLAAP